MLIRGSNCEFTPSKWPKLTLLWSLGPSKYPKKLVLLIKTVLTSPNQLFFEVRPPKSHQSGLNAYQEGQNTNFRLSKWPKLTLLEPLGS